MSSRYRPLNDDALFDALAESFELRPPVYEFGFSTAVNRNGDCGEQSERSDRLEDLTELPFVDASARTVICRGALEHVFEPRRAMAEMHRILMPGGLLFVSVPGSRPLSSGDHFWHFTPQAMERLMQQFESTVIGWQGAAEQPHTVFAVGGKGPIDDAFLRGLNRFPARCQQRLDVSARRIGWIRKFKQTMASWAFSPNERRRFADYYRAQFAMHLPVDKLCKRRFLQSCLGEIKAGARLDLQQ